MREKELIRREGGEGKREIFGARSLNPRSEDRRPFPKQKKKKNLTSAHEASKSNLSFFLPEDDPLYSRGEEKTGAPRWSSPTAE
jgi:hypothetical protein